MSHFVIACGGTGGHLAPGVALAERLRDRGHTSVLLISEKVIDAKLAAKYPTFRFDRIPGAPLIMTTCGLVRFVVAQSRGLVFSWRLIRKERPNGIVGFGGFTTAAIIVAGWLTRVPVMLHEANQVPGRAVRSLAKFAKRVYLPIGVNLPKVSSGKLRHAGLPVRAEIQRIPRHEAAEVFGLDPVRTTIGVLGGSQGASTLNQWAFDSRAELARHGVQLIAITGPEKTMDALTELRDEGGNPVKTVALSFCDNIAAFLSVCDLVVSRAGAGTLAELVQCGVPAILVPYPYAADDHQAANAVDFKRRGDSIVIEENEINELLAAVLGIVSDESRLQQARANVRSVHRLDTLELMLDDVEELTESRGPISRSGPRKQAA
jgi:UDP-N-acetylglucosamine--N-acetylmuramyl-(pentapeptide) pyrophosphoryl-undecaprenol N-acetylglucosamine transferase